MPRLDALTGLRIFAALAVYASHLGPPHASPPWLSSFFDSGYMGVTLFFTLSGFVLAINYFDSMRRPDAHGIWNFFVARFARVYPLYLLVLAYVILRQHDFGVSINGWWEHVLAIQAWSPSMTQAYAFDGPAWSISVEFFLYASVPLLFPVLARLRTPRAAAITAIGVVLAMVALTEWFVLSGRADLLWTNGASAHRWLYRTPLTRLGDFTLGVLAARLYVETRGSKRIETLGAPLAIAAIALIIFLMAWPANVFSPWSFDVEYAVPSALLIFALAAAPRSAPSRLLSVPIVVLLGEASYAFYLVHLPAIGLFNGRRWSLGTSPTTISYETLTLAAILCLAVGLHTMVERPARTYIRRLASRRSLAGGRPGFRPASSE